MICEEGIAMVIDYLRDNCGIFEEEITNQILLDISTNEECDLLEPADIKIIKNMVKDINKIAEKEKYLKAVSYGKFPFQLKVNENNKEVNNKNKDNKEVNENNKEVVIITNNVETKMNDILSVIKENKVIIIRGDTGCGKSTKIPLAILRENLNSKIICTQPRRISAIGLAKYTSKCFKCNLGTTIGYSVRFSNKTTKETKINYVTDGIMLAMLRGNAIKVINNYTHIIIDEAHERTVNIDLLLGLFRERGDQITAKLVIMSATLDSQKFIDFFNATLITIKSRKFNVEEHYLEDPIEDNMETTIDTVIKVANEYSQGNILVFMSGSEEINKAVDQCSHYMEDSPHIAVLPLYGSLDLDQQADVFNVNKRKIIFSTNIAETSITIENVRFVIDTGYVKYKNYEVKTFASTLDKVRISKDQATQRKGRAGRTCDGYVFRMYTEEEYNNFSSSTDPAVLREDLSDCILNLLSLNVSNLREFQWIDQPSNVSINRGLDYLFTIGAINKSLKVTKLGRLLNLIPLPVQLALGLFYAHKMGNLSKVALVAAFLEASPIFQTVPIGSFEHQKKLKAIKKFDKSRGYFYMFLDIYNQWKSKNCSQSFILANYISSYKLEKITQIHKQLMNIRYFKNYGGDTVENIEEPLIVGFYFNIAVNLSENEYFTLYDRVTCKISYSDPISKVKPKILCYNLLVNKNDTNLVTCCLEITEDQLLSIKRVFKRKTKYLRIE